MAFYDKFIELCNEKGEPPSFVARAVGVDKSAATRWSRGSLPRDTTIAKLADHFGVTVDELMDRVPSGYQTKKEDTTNATQPQGTGLAAALEALRDQPGRRMLLAATSGMTEAQVEKVAALFAEIRGGDKD